MCVLGEGSMYMCGWFSTLNAAPATGPGGGTWWASWVRCFHCDNY